MRLFVRLCIALALLCATGTSLAIVHLIAIEQIHTYSGGTVQVVVIRETAGLNGETSWSGHDLTASGPRGVQKTFTFPFNLPNGRVTQIAPFVF